MTSSESPHTPNSHTLWVERQDYSSFSAERALHLRVMPEASVPHGGRGSSVRRAEGTKNIASSTILALDPQTRFAEGSRV